MMRKREDLTCLVSVSTCSVSSVQQPRTPHRFGDDDVSKVGVVVSASSSSGASGSPPQSGKIDLNGKAWLKAQKLRIQGEWTDNISNGGSINFKGNVSTVDNSVLMTGRYTQDGEEEEFEDTIDVLLEPLMNSSDEITGYNLSGLNGDTFSGTIELQDDDDDILQATRQRFAFDRVSKRKKPRVASAAKSRVGDFAPTLEAYIRVNTPSGKASGITARAYFKHAEKAILEALGDSEFSPGMLPSLRDKISAIHSRKTVNLPEERSIRILLKYIDEHQQTAMDAQLAEKLAELDNAKSDNMSAHQSTVS